MAELCKLSEIAIISAGQTFRGRSESDNADSGVRLLQIKDIKEGVYSGAELPWADIDVEKSIVLLNGGELLLPLRGNRSDVMLYEKKHTWPVTTPNQVAIIRPQRVHGPYLLWFLNSWEGRTQINARRSGTTVGHISVKSLADITLPLPELSVQLKIANVYANWLEQHSILEEMIGLGAEMAETLCVELIENRGQRSE